MISAREKPQTESMEPAIPTLATNSRESSTTQFAAESATTGFVSLVGRALFTVAFLASVPAHFGPVDVGFAVAAGVPFAKQVVPVLGVVMLVASIGVLLGYRTKLSAWILVLFLVPVTLTMHNFWHAKDAMLAGIQRGMFIRNVSIIGGGLIMSQFGGGRWSLDALRKSGRSRRDS